MAQFASSNFNGTEGDNLTTFDANWIKQSGSTGNAQIAGGKARATDTTSPAYYYNAAPASSDYTVGAELFIPSGGASSGAFGVLGRAATGANTAYHARYNKSTGAVELFKFVAGTSTSLGSVARSQPATGSTTPFVLGMSGSTIDVTWNGEGTPLISVTDTSITAAGFPGVRWFNTVTPTDTTGNHGDNFSADQAGGGATNLVSSGSDHAHAADNVVLTSSTDLAVNSAAHAHTADSLTLGTTSAVSLSVTDASHAHVADSVALVVASVLAVADAAHGHAADSVGLTTVEALAVASAEHAHSAENVTLTIGGIGLSVADAQHGQAAEAPTLSTDSFLITADSSHGHTADLLTLSTATFFAVDDAVHAQTADNLSLDGAPTLLVAAADHVHIAETVALTMESWLEAANAAHAHTAQNITLSVVVEAEPLTNAEMRELLETVRALQIQLEAVNGYTSLIPALL